MPTICYKEWKNPPQAALETIEHARTILNEYTAQGFDLTLRQLYYQFVARGLLANKKENYDKLGDTIVRARESGMIDWNYIKDRARHLESNAHWDTPADIVEACAKQFKLDLWEDQPFRVECWVEKEALIDVVGRAARLWDVGFLANKGYLSATTIWEAAHDRFLRWGNDPDHPQDIVVLHLGDHDPSGVDMTRDIRDRLELFSTPYRRDGERLRRPEIEVRRIALNMDQIEQYEPPPNPAKVTDSRARKYMDEFGDESWELDALEPSVIVDLITEHIEGIVDSTLFDARKAQQAQGRKQLSAISDNWDEVTDNLPDQEEEEDEET